VKNTFITSVVLLVIGIIGLIYANAASFVDESGMVHDSIWYPISGLLIFISVIILVVLAVIAVIRYFRNR
jgi:hypothetical protein